MSRIETYFRSRLVESLGVRGASIVGFVGEGVEGAEVEVIVSVVGIEVDDGRD